MGAIGGYDPPVVRIALLIAPVIAAVVLWHPWPRHGADRIRHLVDWPACASVTESHSDRWRDADEDTLIECEMLGPWVEHARFPSHAALRSDLLAASPSSAVCIYGDGTEVAINGLEAHQFPKLCRKLEGTRVDGVVGLRDLLGAPTADAEARAARRQGERDTKAEHAALVKYFATER
jgi:hypothetical protein